MYRISQLYFFLIATTVNKCDITCRENQSCSVYLSASRHGFPGDIRSGSCPPKGECSFGYPVHCQKCNDFCQNKQNPGTYETAVITIGLFGKPVNQTTRPEGKFETFIKIVFLFIS